MKARNEVAFCIAMHYIVNYFLTSLVDLLQLCAVTPG
jgi:hypothetical protein